MNVCYRPEANLGNFARDMNAFQKLITAILFSLPIIGLLAILRVLSCARHCFKSKNTVFFILSCLYIIIMISVLAYDAVVLFAYGVAHTGKSASTDFIVFASTVIPTYFVAGSAWFFSSFIEKRLNKK